MSRVKIKKIISAGILILCFMTMPALTACHGNKPYVKSKKMISSSSGSATAQIVVKNPSFLNDYNVTLTVKIRYRGGWGCTGTAASGSSTGEGEGKAYGAVAARKEHTFTVTVQCPGKNNPKISSVTITYTKVEAAAG